MPLPRTRMWVKHPAREMGVGMAANTASCPSAHGWVRALGSSVCVNQTALAVHRHGFISEVSGHTWLHGSEGEVRPTMAGSASQRKAVHLMKDRCRVTEKVWGPDASSQ